MTFGDRGGRISIRVGNDSSPSELTSDWMLTTRWSTWLFLPWMKSTIGSKRGSPQKAIQYGLTWDMVDWKGRMLNIPRSKNEEPIHVPLNDAAVAALNDVHNRVDGRGRVSQSTRTGEPLENGRHWFDDAVMKAGIKNFRWHDLRYTFASPCERKALRSKTLQKSLTMARRYAHISARTS